MKNILFCKTGTIAEKINERNNVMIKYNLENYGYCSSYQIDQEGNVFNKKTGRKLKLSKDNCYFLVSKDGKNVKRSINTLYKQVFGKSFIKIDDIENLQNEEWKPITFANDYYISNKGRVKSTKKNKAILLKPDLTRKKKGYQRVQLYINNVGQHYLVHRLVALYFIDQTPKKQDLPNFVVHHKNFICTDNRVQNLEWLTKQQHKQKHKKANKEIDDNDSII